MKTRTIFSLDTNWIYETNEKLDLKKGDKIGIKRKLYEIMHKLHIIDEHTMIFTIEER